MIISNINTESRTGWLNSNKYYKKLKKKNETKEKRIYGKRTKIGVTTK